MRVLKFPFGIMAFFIMEEELVAIIAEAHVQGFLDGLDADNYNYIDSPGYEKAAGKYTVKAINELVAFSDKQEED